MSRKIALHCDYSKNTVRLFKVIYFTTNLADIKSVLGYVTITGVTS